MAELLLTFSTPAPPTPPTVPPPAPKPALTSHASPPLPDSAAWVTPIAAPPKIVAESGPPADWSPVVATGLGGVLSGARDIHLTTPPPSPAIDAVRQWRFTPTLLNGVPVAVKMGVTVNFTLH